MQTTSVFTKGLHMGLHIGPPHRSPHRSPPRNPRNPLIFEYFLIFFLYFRDFWSNIKVFGQNKVGIV